MRLCRFRRLSVIALTLVALFVRGPLAHAQDNELEVREHFAAARHAQDVGDLNTAAAEYAAVLRLQPDLAEVYANLGLVYYMQGNFEESAKALRHAATLKPELLGCQLFLGIDYVKMHRPAEGIIPLKRAIQQEPANKEAISWLSTALWDAGQTRSALDHLRKATHVFPNDTDILFLLGEAYQKAAAQELELVVARSVNVPLYHQVFGDTYSDMQVWDKAVRHYNAALVENARWKGAHLGLAKAYFQQSKLTEAEAEFRDELAIDPSSAASLAGMGDIAIIRGAVPDALSSLTAAVRISPVQAANWFGLPLVASPSGADRVDQQTLTAYRQALPALMQASPSPVRSLALSALFTRLGSEREAEENWNNFSKSLARSRPTADLVSRAANDFASRNFDSAERNYEALLSVKAEDMQAHYMLGRTYQYLSLSVLNRMLSLDPNSYRAHQLLAKTYERRDENGQALEEYQKVEQQQPDLPGLHFAIGHLLWTMSRPEEALMALRKELRIDPDHAEANAEVGTILISQHQERQAVAYLEKAIHLKPDLITARQQLGMAFYREKDFPHAEQILKANLSDDGEGTAHFILGMVYRQMGRPEESRLALEQSRKIRAQRTASVDIQKPGSMP